MSSSNRPLPSTLAGSVLATSLLAFSLACPAPKPHPTPHGEGEGEGEGEGALGEGEGEGQTASSNPFFVAVGYGGRRVISADGITWTNDVADAQNGGDDDNLLRGVCQGLTASGRVVVAVGGSVHGRILTTTDGVAWTTALDDQLGWLGGCAFSDDGVIVAVGSGRAIRSLDGGQTWVDPQTEFFNGANWQARDAAFLAGTFAAAGDEGVSTSTDGKTWSAPVGPTQLSHIAAGNGAWVAIAPGVRAHSTDAVQWTVEQKNGVKSVTFDGAQFVVVGDQVVQFSADGTTWDEHTGEPFLDLVAFGLVPIAGAPTHTLTYVSSTFPDKRKVSNDALAWNDTASDQTNIISAIVFAP